ncbi:glycosyltransferase [Stigmatella sp. ncwal1]|uniref:Glycosyltransferase n=1 Tax=Stigmatella ashevillensis TaxID=2995309 RepID=A0ABT5DNR4_9BACT|nr:glycosyltransferase [Stigmatella ashevillena]MDC0715238.1 glycosyltransferase [Stigmatella ashevillena]
MNSRPGAEDGPSGDAALWKLADPRGLDIPPSHRGGVGQGVTWAKRRLLHPIEPLQRALLEGQFRFNAALVRGLAQLPRNPVKEAREALLPLVTQASVRGGASGWRLSALSWQGEALLARQHAWNLAAVEALVAAAEVWPLWTAPVVEQCTGLAVGADVVEAAWGRGKRRVAFAFWREAWRRQIAFHHAFAEALKRALGVARPRMLLPTPAEYAAWWTAHEGPARGKVEAVESARGPRFSLAVPAYETPEPYLRACIESVLAQSYPDWQLCIVDDGSRGSGVEHVVRSYARKEPRIVFERLARNVGIAQATNAALAHATGDFVAFLDHDDVLAPRALEVVAQHIAASPQGDVFYSDEDKIDAHGVRHAPYFKPALSPDLLRSVNYICHFLVVRARLLQEVGGIRSGFEGAQDHELLLRLLERTQRFHHIPEVLYHWRVHAGSTSSDASAKPAASEAGRRAVEEHLQRQAEAGAVETTEPGVYRVRYPLAGTPCVSLLLHGGPEGTEVRDARELLGRMAYPAVEVRIACAAPAFEAFNALAAEDARVRGVPIPGERGHAERLNTLVRESSGELLLFLERGCIPAEPGALEELVSQVLRPGYGVIGGTLVHEEGTLDSAGWVLGVGGGASPLFAGLPDPALTVLGGSRWVRNLSAVPSTCLMIRRSLFEQVGGFEEGDSEAGCVVALCARVRQRGLRILGTPHARWVRRARGVPSPLLPKEWERLRQGALLEKGSADPFYHPGLSQERADGRLPGMGR